MLSYASKSPGVYFEEASTAPEPELRTGVPAFIGMIPQPADETGKIVSLDLSAWAQREQAFDDGEWTDAHLRFALRGFFENGGERCFVVPMNDTIDEALAELEKLDGIDLVAA